MAKSDLTDEEKAAKVLGEVEAEKPDEPTEPESPTEPETEESEEPELEEEEEKPSESEEEPAGTFTKQFPNLKGETLEEYNHELETAYDNSFKEALRMQQEIKDNAEIVAQAKKIVEQANASVEQKPAETTPVAPASSVAQSPELEWIRAERRRVMMQAFDEFKQDYPQVLDQAEFDRFSKASDGVKAGLAASMGRDPSDIEVFKAVAGSFGWQPNQDKKNATIKENASSSRTGGGQSPATPRRPKVTDAQVDVYLKMFTSKTREEAIKELSEVV